MKNEKVLAEIQTIVRDVIDDDTILLSNDLLLSEIDGWDSLSHVQIVVSLESKFGIQFLSKEILSWNTIEDIVSSIVAKC